MPVQILGGIAKGHSLEVPSGSLIRPTSVLLRRKIFDSFQDLSGYIFIDLCAGSGAMGFEAWSRGAQEVYFIEKNKKVFRTLSDNFHMFSNRYKNEFKQRSLIIKNSPVERWLPAFFENYEVQKQYIIFFDPPYNKHNLYEFICNLFKNKKGIYKGKLWIESDHLTGFSINDLNNYFGKEDKIIKHSDSFIWLKNFI